MFCVDAHLIYVFVMFRTKHFPFTINVVFLLFRPGILDSKYYVYYYGVTVFITMFSGKYILEEMYLSCYSGVWGVGLLHPLPPLRRRVAAWARPRPREG